MRIADILLGKPIPSSEEQHSRVGPVHGIPVFGLDALSSAAYGPEAALTVLIVLGTRGVHYIVPLSAAIIVLLVIVYFSYRQTIAAYPQGGGSYLVARDNLGEGAALLAAAALMVDYLLNVAVGISAGVGALVSVVPSLQPHTLGLCLTILALLTIVNLRGVREAGAVFMIPSYLFVASLFAVIGWGIYQVVATGGHPLPVSPPPKMPHPAVTAASAWLLIRAFASGCTALTGVEAVSNGVQAFREPVVKSARATLAAIIATLVVLLAGIAYLANAYGIAATPPGEPGYQSVLSMITSAVAGRGTAYRIAMASILAVLCLSANTSFADFPRLCRSVASDGYLPRSFANSGRRLVYSEGIWVLALLSAFTLILFGGVTDRLIPLFAVGAFLAFTLSQAGMVVHWKRHPGRHSRHSMAINAMGGTLTGLTLMVILAAKFTAGAWFVVLLIPAILWLMGAVHRHYQRVCRETVPDAGFLAGPREEPIVMVPIENWNTVSQKALRFALTISREVEVIHVGCKDDELVRDWEKLVLEPARHPGLPEPKLAWLDSPYRLVLQPILDHVLSAEQEYSPRTITVVLPYLVERHWYHYFLHNQRAELLTALLVLKSNRRINIVSVPWHLNA
jgi:amino acid transporter